MRSLNLDHLATLAAVLALGSFSAAARRLNLTQPAVSLQIRDLEQRYGVRLVERLGKRAFATEAGRALLLHQERLAAEAEAALAMLRRYREGWLGRVRFGTGTATLAYRLLPKLKDLRQRYPTLELIASTGMTEDIVQGVRENRLDLGLVTLPAQGQGLVLQEVFREPLVAVLPADDAALCKSLPLRPRAADLARHTIILEANHGGAARLIYQWFADSGVPLKPAMLLGSIEAVRNSVLAGLGISILPLEMTTDRHFAAEIVARTLSPPLVRTMALVHRREKAADPALRVLADAILSLSDR